MIPALDVMQPESANALAPELERDAVRLAEQLADVAIRTADEATGAVQARARIATMRQTVEAYFAPIKGLAYKLHRGICDRERAITAKLDARDRVIAVALSTWKRDEDARRLQAEREAQAQAHRDQQTAAVHEAAALETGGDELLAAAVVAEAIATPPPVVTLPDVARTVPGLKFRKTWKWKYTGGPADVKQTSANTIARTLQLIPRDFLMVDEMKLGAYVRSMKTSASVPGIEIYSVEEPVR